MDTWKSASPRKDPADVRIGGGRVSVYVDVVLRKLQEDRSVSVFGKGRTVTKAISVVEVAKRRAAAVAAEEGKVKVEQDTRIFAEMQEKGDDEEDAEQDPKERYTGSPASSQSNGSAFTQYALEQQNDDEVDVLSQKMSILKEVSLQIGDEVNYQNKLLGEMEDDFHKTGGMLGVAMKRFNTMSKSQTGRWMCYLILFVILTRREMESANTANADGGEAVGGKRRPRQRRRSKPNAIEDGGGDAPSQSASTPPATADQPKPNAAGASHSRRTAAALATSNAAVNAADANGDAGTKPKRKRNRKRKSKGAGTPGLPADADGSDESGEELVTEFAAMMVAPAPAVGPATPAAVGRGGRAERGGSAKRGGRVGASASVTKFVEAVSGGMDVPPEESGGRGRGQGRGNESGRGRSADRGGRNGDRGRGASREGRGGWTPRPPKPTRSNEDLLNEINHAGETPSRGSAGRGRGRGRGGAERRGGDLGPPIVFVKATGEGAGAGAGPSHPPQVNGEKAKPETGKMLGGHNEEKNKGTPNGGGSSGDWKKKNDTSGKDGRGDRKNKNELPNGTGGLGGDWKNKNETPHSRGGHMQGRGDSSLGGNWQRRNDQNRPLSERKLWEGNNNSNQNTPSKNQKALFEDYISLDEVQEGLKRKTLFEGTLRINKKNSREAYVTVDGFEEDVFIAGKFKRNRAFEGDVVIVQLLTGDELKDERERDDDQKERKRRDNAERQANVRFDDEEVEPVEEILVGEEDVKEPTIFGKVVFILERRESHFFVGTLSVEMPASKNPTKHTFGAPVDASIKMIWMRPTDKRIPFTAIPVENAPHEYLKNPAAYENHLWQASIKRWPNHLQSPYGIVHGTIGLIGTIAVETEALLIENGIHWDEFSDEVLACLPATPWKMPQEEIRKRKDFRSTRIFSVDPLTARDLDDALSITACDDGTFEVGVHIADVSYFVPDGSALDREAFKRATTVYLVQKAIPMLPRLLCEELCSLNPGVDRFAFSVLWKMDADAKIIGEPWFGRSVIRSCAKLSYDHAQALIEGRDWEGLPPVEITGEGNTIEEVREDTMRLYRLSLKLREKRQESGALSINSIKLWFSIDGDGNPENTGVYELKDSNRMIEEFMLLANMSVAKRISTTYPETSLLRRHEPPKPKPLREFVELAKDLGYEFDVSTSSSFQASFDKIQNADVREALKQVCIKPMQRAKYFCTGITDLSGWSHYALNVALYTHFTSPIRRYCDLVVHRLLDAALILEAEKDMKGRDPAGETSKAFCPYDQRTVGQIAKQCNERKFASKDAQDASSRLYLTTYLNRAFGGAGVVAEGLVFKIGERSYDVLVNQFGIEKRVWVEDLVESGEIHGCEHDKNANALVVYWRIPEEGTAAELAVDDGDEDWETEEEEEALPGGKRSGPAKLVSPSKQQQLGSNFPILGVPRPPAPYNMAPKKKARNKADIDMSKTKVQRVEVFQRVLVRIKVTGKSPPEIKLLPVYPLDNVGFVAPSRVRDLTSSCPGIVDEAD
ncbi:hypothetical protein HK101_010950 [Irineochytrium annulatum]|nr:hypothetical protein HK101_010950 [Irineochytrium annulatum]